MKKISTIIISVIIILGVFYFWSRKEVVAPVVESTVITDKDINTVMENGELCFAKFGLPNNNGYYDKYTLRMILNGEKVTGELNFLPAEKDSKTGEIEGTVGEKDATTKVRTADLWWFNFAEGMSAQEQVKIIFNENTANIGFGEVVDRGDGIYVYKDPQNIAYTLNLAVVSCLDFIKRTNIENYLQDNISELSPVKAILGGTWYVVSITLDLIKNYGTVIYEDGHIQEKKNFTYTLSEKGEVVKLTIQ
ncbi:hypothetical protein KKG24_01700 [Patescibacteria group bacterium]|nr:hypothetical protein [Patescibacteria group bacterium]